MGINLVSAAVNRRWSCLSDLAHLVLVCMAVRALDDPDAGGRIVRRYFGGHDALVLQLRGVSPGDAGYDAACRAVRRATKELRTAGAIELVNKPRAGRRAEYILRPDDLFS